MTGKITWIQSLGVRKKAIDSDGLTTFLVLQERNSLLNVLQRSVTRGLKSNRVWYRRSVNLSFCLRLFSFHYKFNAVACIQLGLMILGDNTQLQNMATGFDAVQSSLLTCEHAH
jgi:hypothetical protein